MGNPQRRLRVVEAKGIENTVTAPPILYASSHTIELRLRKLRSGCGNCGAVLLHAEDDQVHGLFIRCAKCESLNTTAD